MKRPGASRRIRRRDGCRSPRAPSRGIRLALPCAALLAALAARADDGRYQDFPIGTRAMALGGSFVALGDDPSGLYYNPAGVVDARRYNVSVSASLYGIERQSRGAIELKADSVTLRTINVIPGEAGFLKGFGALTPRGSPLALGFDVTVPSFRSSGSDVSEPFGPLTRQLHSRVLDRTFVVAAGGGYRIDERFSVGVSLQYWLRLFEQVEDALVTGSGANPPVGVYHADASFESGNLVALLGGKLRFDGGRWLFGAAMSLAGIELHSAGKVNVQDVVADPATGQTSVQIFNEVDRVHSHTPSPVLARLGFARVEPRQWTLTGQLTLTGGASYDRFSVPEPLASRLRIQNHVERKPVLNLNAGGEYLITPDYSIALGLFTDHSGAASLDTNPDGTLRPGSSRLPNLNLYGGTLTLGMIGQHSISRMGLSLAYGGGEDAVVNDTTPVASTTYERVQVHQLFLYVFVASTFRY